MAMRRASFHQALEQVVLADRLGYDYAWEVEHHGIRRGEMQMRRTTARVGIVILSTMALQGCASDKNRDILQRTGLEVCEAAKVTLKSPDPDSRDVRTYTLSIPPSCRGGFLESADRSSEGECGKMLPAKGSCLYFFQGKSVIVRRAGLSGEYSVEYY